MSTRANIILKNEYSHLFFYRHSDGYPEGCLPILEKFISLVKDKNIRNSVSQAGGWLIVLGAMEYQTLLPSLFTEGGVPSWEQNNKKVDKIIKEFIPADWKVGSIEPTSGIHGDVEYVYIIDLETEKLYIASDKCKNEKDFLNKKNWKKITDKIRKQQ